MDDIETEELLPRPAPKSASADSAATDMKLLAKPTVPELSIILGQQCNELYGIKPSSSTPSGAAVDVSSSAAGILSPTGAQGLKKNLPNDFFKKFEFAPKISYAEWKKMRATTGSSVNVSGNIDGGQASNAPFRTVAPATSAQTVSYEPISTMGHHHMVTGPHPSLEGLKTGRRSWEGVCCSAPVTRANSEFAYYTGRHQHDYSPTPSVTSIATPTPSLMNSMKDEVLTICAGTQTGPIDCDDLNQLVTKNEIRELIDLVREIRKEQQEFRNLYEILLEKSEEPPQVSKNSRVFSRSVASQCDLIAEQLSKRKFTVFYFKINVLTENCFSHF